MTAPPAFWDFSLRIYVADGVSDACLALQDHCGADVNLLLYMLWAAERGRRLDRGEVDAVAERTEAWQRDVVRPLRSARRALKTPLAHWSPEAATLRRRIQTNELEAERLQQMMMAALFESEYPGQPDEPTAAAAANLQTYATAIGADFPSAQKAVLLTALRR